MLEKSTKLLFTNRVELRKFNYDDTKNQSLFVNNTKIKCDKFLNANSDKTIEEQISYYISAYEKDGYFNWHMILRKNKDSVGQAIGVNYDDKENSIEIKLIVSEKYQNRSYGYEVLTKLLEFFFLDVAVDKVIFTADKKVPAMNSLIEKFSFNKEREDDEKIIYSLKNIDYMKVFTIIADI